MEGCSALLMADVFINKFYSLAEKQLVSLGGDDTERLGGAGDDYVVVGSSHGWIALFKYNPLDLFLWNPVTHRRINLPPINNLPTPKNSYGGYCYVEITKLILSSSNPEDANCRVVVLYGAGCVRLACCCPGQSGTDWVSIGSWWYHNEDDSVEDRLYADMAYSSQHNRLFCTVDSPNNELERWDLEDPWSPRMDGDDSGQRREEELIYEYEYKEGEDRSIYVVIAEDEVLVVVRKTYEGSTTGFIIFKVVEGEVANLTLHPLHSFDAGLAMFIGLNHSFTLSATEFPELKPNSIYFTDVYYRYDIGIFDYQSRVFYPCYSSKQHRNGPESDEEDNDGRDEEHNAEEEEEDNDEEHNAEESNEEDNDGSNEEHNAEEEEDNDGSDEEDGSYIFDEENSYRSQPKFVWFRPSSPV